MNALLEIFLETIWFLLPAGVANTVPVVAAHWRWLAVLGRPLDGGKTWRGIRLLGDNKTIRGVVVGILFGSIVGYFQHLAFATQPVIQSISLVSYRSASAAILLGAWLSFGALLGDAVKSFFKRQLNIAPGKPWWPFDQIDFALGVMLVSFWFVPLTIAHVVIALFGTGIISLVVSVIGVQLKIKKTV